MITNKNDINGNLDVNYVYTFI